MNNCSKIRAVFNGLESTTCADTLLAEYFLMAGQRNSYGKLSHSQSDYADNGGNKRRNTGSDKDLSQSVLTTQFIGTYALERRLEVLSAGEDALFKVHEKIVSETIDEDSENAPQVTIRLLVPSDQIGCVIGKGGQIVQNIRSESGAQIRILKDNHLPACALSSDELLQHLLASAAPNIYSSSSLVGHTVGAPIVGMASLMGSYRGYKGETNIGGVIGKGGVIINQIRQESGAAIKVDSSAAEGDDCVISISVKEFFEDTYSPTVEAALRLQPRCSEKVDRDSGLTPLTTRLLVPTSRIGCLIGKGGTIINEMRKITKANIRVLSKEGLPKFAAEDDEMVQEYPVKFSGYL
ncbi:hypothetical protein MTR67_010800 [Solanum verrucosum]|uniref:K Homology domain-containing protein n=1 Tax=Solanum verrucosum TaxID=315347 RepID=A0AAF0Q9V0_SOLVR|nr:hypothetical protein MTR67_010800 [Solanum verrucosum]